MGHDLLPLCDLAQILSSAGLWESFLDEASEYQERAPVWSKAKPTRPIGINPRDHHVGPIRDTSHRGAQRGE